MPPVELRRRVGLVLIALTSLAAIAALLARGPIPQPPGYHAFADQRSLLGVPNFGNVVSNLGFLLVGLAGLWELRRGVPGGGLAQLRTSYRSFFIGVLLVAFGSAYYHWAPTSQTLVWDRLTMSIAFMAFFSILVGEHVAPAWGARLPVPLCLLGVGAVLYWIVTDGMGRGDLRPYVLVQYLPIALTPLLLLLFPSRLSNVGYLWGLLGAYALAKILELQDARVFALTQGVVSGHSLKHLAAAAGMYGFLVALRHRERRAT